MRPEQHPVEFDHRESQSVTTLLRRLTHELATLLRQELSLAAAELTQTLNRILTAAAGVAAGGAVVFAGLLVLLAAAVLGLSVVVAPWLAALIVGAGTILIGIVVTVAASHKLKPESLKPERTARSLAKDKDVLTRTSS
jgi:uncharacterized membrane protein YqjE